MKQPPYGVDDLLDVMATLRDPERGCPWDRAQTFASIAPFTLEEAYELADTLERGDFAHLKEELGDLLFQVVFYAQMGREQQLFDFGDIVSTLVEKLRRRHPHVFPADGGSGADIGTDEVKQQWERIKQEERARKQQSGLMADVPLALPALSRAAKLQRRAAGVGFDWPGVEGVLSKLAEELHEVEQARLSGEQEAIEDEVGDVLFCAVNLARHLKVDPEQALRRSNTKFERRWAFIEAELRARGSSPDQASLAEMDALWEMAKRKGG